MAVGFALAGCPEEGSDDYAGSAYGEPETTDPTNAGDTTDGGEEDDSTGDDIGSSGSSTGGDSSSEGGSSSGSTSTGGGGTTLEPDYGVPTTSGG